MKNKPNWEELRFKIAEFGERLNSVLEKLGIVEECKQLEIDHICVRLSNSSDVVSLKEELTAEGEVISSVEVNGREISIIQLDEPLKLGFWQTSGVELPHPKPNHNYEDGWEHVEFVLKGAENTMDGVRKAFRDTFANLEQETLQTDYSYSEDVPHAKGDQIANPTIGLTVDGVGIKFHANPIQVVVGAVE